MERMGRDLGLTARDMNDMGRLAQLAANPQGTTKEEIFLAVASLYRVQGSYLNPRERALMQEILRRLARDVEMAIRISLAERLAEDANAPHDLIVLLADDAIEVARPLILRSPLLTETDILRMIGDCGPAHHEAVAQRPNIGEPVCDALVKLDSESVLGALLRNVTARISSQAFETLVEKSRNIANLQDPLAHRKDLPPELATRMCEWVSDALKTWIVHNYRVEPQKLDRTLEDIGQSLHHEPPAPRAQPGESAQKLIDKLAASGQLKAGFLLRVLHQGQIDLFDLAFAKLLGAPLEDLRRKFYEMGPKPVALACRAVGIDRCVFATVFNLSRQARKMRPVLSPAELSEVSTAFAAFSKPQALEMFQKL